MTSLYVDVAARFRDFDKGNDTFRKFSESMTAIGAAAGVVGGAVAAAGAAVIELGKRGAEVDDVTSAFNRLNTAGPGALGALREGIGGLLTDVELMKPMNAALSAGWQANAQDMQTVTRAAWVLADAQGKDLKDSYETITKALATGKVAALGALGVNVEQKGAALALKAALDSEGEAVTSNATKQANRQAALEALNRVVLQAGSQELDFGEKLTRVKVQVGNMVDSLSVAIATSPVIGAAMDAAGDALQSAFGANQTDTIKSLVGWINQFAIYLVDAAQMAVTGAKYIVFAWDGLKILFSSLMVVIFALAEGVNKSFAAILEGAAKIPGVGKNFRAMADDMRDTANQTEGMRKSFQQQTSQALDNAGVQAGAFDKVSGALSNVRDRMVAASNQSVTSEGVAKNLATAHDGLTSSITGSSKALDDWRKAVQAILDKVLLVDLTKEAQQWGEALDKLGGTSALSSSQLKAFADEAAKLRDAGVALSPTMLELARVHDLDAKATAEDKAQKDAAAAAFQRLNQATGDYLKNLPTAILQTTSYAGAVDQVSGAAASYTGNLSRAADGTVLFKGQAVDTTTAMSKFLSVLNAAAQALDEIGGDFGKFGKDLVTIAAQLETASKSVNGLSLKSGVFAGALDKNSSATERWASGTAASISVAGDAVSAWDKISNASGKATATMTGAAEGAKIGTKIFPGYGTAIGAAAGAIIGFVRSLSGGRRAVEDFAKSFGGFDQLHDKLSTLGDTGEQMWIKLTQGTAKGDKGAALKTIQEITDAFAKQQEQLQKDNDTLGGLLNQLDAAGGRIPTEWQGILDSLTKQGEITEANAKQMQSLMGETVVTTKQAEDVAQKYNLSLDKLGPTYQKQKLHESFQELIDDMDVLTQTGADVSAMLTQVGEDGKLGFTGIGQKVQDLVIQSQKSGVEMPENMKPWVQSLIDQGLLLDATGQKITDINQVKFGESLQTSVQKLVDAIKQLIDNFGKVTDAIAKVPDKKTIDFTFNGKKTGEWPTNTDTGADGSQTFHSGTANVLAFPTAIVAHNGVKPDELPAHLGNETPARESAGDRQNVIVFVPRKKAA